ncbi:MAG: DUF6438 domain-containing protein [Taibaiella sp.]|nr:DUF6438 domain-containing protein [Taibaiella sp.]
MKKLTLLFLLLIAASASFAKMAKQKKKSKATNEIVSVGMHRTVCFGTCPDYKIEIDRNGSVTYTAIRFTADTGIFKKNIGKAKAKEIMDMFVKYRADTCREMYESLIADLPGLNFTMRYKDRKKNIYTSGFGPEFLTDIAEAMDAIVATKDKTWRKTGMPKVD